MPSLEELRLEFCRIFAANGLDEHTAIHRAEKIVQYIINGPKKAQPPELKEAA